MNVSFVITLDNGIINGTGTDIIADISFSGTATPSDDYVNFITVSIPDGASSSVIILAIIDDALDECDETVIATLSNPTIGSINTTASSSTAIIVDDECTNSVDALVNVDFEVYPNPASSLLYLRSEKYMKRYKILDLNGRIVTADKINSKDASFSTQLISSGNYLVEVEFENGKIVRKKMKKK